jgi:hypothetical protein
MAAVTKGIWISYDLGIGGDYPGLYQWLDTKGGEECGEGLVFLNYSFEPVSAYGISSDELPKVIAQHLKQELSQSIKTDRSTRIYMIYGNRGEFIFGGRKSNPWKGYAPNAEAVVDIAAA